MTITLQPKASPGHHIIGLDSEHLNGGTVPWHKHLYAQLLYPAEGVVRIWAGESVWLVHASSALWLPPQMPHKFVATGNVLLKTVLVSEAESETLGKVCFMTGISPLLRELLIAINQLPLQTRRETGYLLFVSFALSTYLFGGMAADVAGVVSCRSADRSGDLPTFVLRENGC